MPTSPPKCSACGGGGDRVQVVSDHRRYANGEPYSVQVWLCASCTYKRLVNPDPAEITKDKRGVVKKQRETLFDPRAS